MLRQSAMRSLNVSLPLTALAGGATNGHNTNNNNNNGAVRLIKIEADCEQRPLDAASERVNERTNERVNKRETRLKWLIIKTRCSPACPLRGASISFALANELRTTSRTARRLAIRLCSLFLGQSGF